MQPQNRKSDYNFVFGVFKSRESELLDDYHVENLLRSGSFEEAVTQVPESPFSDELRKSANEKGIDSGISGEFNEISSFLQLNAPSEELKKLVFTPWDFFNLKVSVLSKLREKKIDELYGPEGDVSMEQLLSATEEMNFSWLPQDIYDALQEAWIAYYDADKNTQAFEFALDREKNLLLIKTAADSGSQELLRFFTAAAEIKISELLIRGKTAGIEWDIVSAGLKNYHILNNFKDTYANTPQDWQGFTAGLREGILRRTLNEFSEGKNISEIILKLKHELYRGIEKWRYYSPSIEYAYYFLSRKTADLYNCRLILLGKLNGIPSETLQKRILNVCI
ncbi:MAG: hypothetical protein GXP33_05455 [Spirochaetes bacterium]|nr:hypothetical protein [Spirochaetota bacterium]